MDDPKDRIQDCMSYPTFLASNLISLSTFLEFSILSSQRSAMLKLDKDIFINIANHITLCISIITLGLLVRMVSTDYSNHLIEIQQGKILLERTQQQK
jgi:hypothetical protein